MAENKEAAAPVEVKGTSPPGEEVFIVVDEAGFVGAFFSKVDADKVPQMYPMLTFAYYRYSLCRESPKDFVWVIPYAGCNAVAYASNSIEKSRQVQKILSKLSLSYSDDDVAHWKFPIGSLIEPVRKRLRILSRGCELYASAPGQVEAATQKSAEALMTLLTPADDGPLSRLSKESEKTTILDCVEIQPFEAQDGGAEPSESEPSDPE